MTEEQQKFALSHQFYPISYGYFCGEPIEKCVHQWESSSFLVTSCRLCGELQK